MNKEKEKETERKESDAAINYLLLNPPVAAHPTTAELCDSLCIACSTGEVGRAEKILLTGVDVNLQSRGSTPAFPVFIACYQGHAECLSLLINHGAQLDKADKQGATPTYIACQNGHKECLSLLINHGAQLDKADNQGATPTYMAP